MILLFLIDALMLAAISSVFGLGSWLLGASFWVGFAFSFWLSFVIGIAYNRFYITKVNRQIANINLEAAKLASTQEIILTCAFCKQSNLAVFNKSGMDFICTQCKSPNRVMPSFSTIQISKPMDGLGSLDILPDAELDKVTEDGEAP